MLASYLTRTRDQFISMQRLLHNELGCAVQKTANVAAMAIFPALGSFFVTLTKKEGLGIKPIFCLGGAIFGGKILRSVVPFLRDGCAYALTWLERAVKVEDITYKVLGMGNKVAPCCCPEGGGVDSTIATVKDIVDRAEVQVVPHIRSCIKYRKEMGCATLCAFVCASQVIAKIAIFHSMMMKVLLMGFCLEMLRKGGQVGAREEEAEVSVLTLQPPVD